MTLKTAEKVRWCVTGYTYSTVERTSSYAVSTETVNNSSGNEHHHSMYDL